jgi:hypothetical protein
MRILYVLRFAATAVASLVLVCVSFSSAQAASTITQTSIKGGVGACTGGNQPCGGPSSYGFVDPDITVQYNAQVENGSGQIIPPGGSVSCGQQITLQCLPHQDDDISWFTTGGADDSPYGTWNTLGSSCIDKYFAFLDTVGQTGGYIFANLSFQYPTQNITGTTQLMNCTTLADGCSMTCTAVNTGTSPVTVPVAFSYSSTNGTFYGSLLSGVNHGTIAQNSTSDQVVTGGRCISSSLPMSIRNVASAEYQYLSSTQGVFWTAFWGTPNPMTTVTVPAAQIAYPITITPSTTSSSPQCAAPTTTTTTPPPTCTGNSCLPTPPTVTSAGTQTCTLNTAFTINFTATDPQNQAIQYQISWNGDGSVNQVVPASGYVPSGTTESATRTYTVAGSQTVQVRAVNSSGAVSPWTTFTFNCSAAATTGQGNQCSAGNICQGSKLCQEDASCNIDPNSCQTCAYGCGSGACLGAPSPTLSIKAVPSLVQQASTTKVSWSATNVTSCNITGTNGDGSGSNATGLWGCTGLQCLSTTTMQSTPIQNQTIYTLMCTEFDNSTSSKQAVVNVVPIFQEK